MAAATPAAAGALSGCPIRTCSIMPRRWQRRSIITSIRARLTPARATSRLIRPIGKAASAPGTAIDPIGATAHTTGTITGRATVTCSAVTTDRRIQLKTPAPVRDPRSGVVFLEASAHQAELAGADVERQHRGVRYVQAFDLAGHIEPRHGAAGFTRQLPQAFAFRAK